MLLHNTEKTETRPGNAPQQWRSSWQKLFCFWWPVLQQFHKSLIIVKYHVASESFVTHEW